LKLQQAQEKKGGGGENRCTDARPDRPSFGPGLAAVQGGRGTKKRGEKKGRKEKKVWRVERHSFTLVPDRFLQGEGRNGREGEGRVGERETILRLYLLSYYPSLPPFRAEDKKKKGKKGKKGEEEKRRGRSRERYR